MQILTIRFPEMEHLPSERREAMLRRCIDSPDMQRLRVRWGRYPAVCAAVVGAAVAINTDMILHLSTTTTVIAAAVAIVGSFAVVMLLKPVAEYRLIRRLLRHQLHDHAA